MALSDAFKNGPATPIRGYVSPWAERTLRLTLNSAFARGDQQTLARHLEREPQDAAAVLALVHLLRRPKRQAVTPKTMQMALEAWRLYLDGRAKGIRKWGLPTQIIHDLCVRHKVCERSAGKAWTIARDQLARHGKL